MKVNGKRVTNPGARSRRVNRNGHRRAQTALKAMLGRDGLACGYAVERIVSTVLTAYLRPPVRRRAAKA